MAKDRRNKREEQEQTLLMPETGKKKTKKRKKKTAQLVWKIAKSNEDINDILIKINQLQRIC